jgi:hypothetical protein
MIKAIWQLKSQTNTKTNSSNIGDIKISELQLEYDEAIANSEKKEKRNLKNSEIKQGKINSNNFVK